MEGDVRKGWSYDMNTTTELIDNLRYYNQWRRGEHDDQPESEDIGIWLDDACEKLAREGKAEKKLEEALLIMRNVYLQLSTLLGFHGDNLTEEQTKYLANVIKQIELILKP